MSTPDTLYIETLQSLDRSTIVSTGQVPERLKDLLVIGDAPREAYFYDLEGIDSILATDPVRSDDALLLQTPQGRVGVAYHQREAFLDMASNLVSGRMIDPIVKPWSIGPWLPETFASDLSRAKVVRCEDATVAAAFDTVKTYPRAMGAAIVASCSQEITTKGELLASKASTELARSQLKTDICLAGIRLLYASESVYFRGLRYTPETQTGLSAGAAALSVALESTERHHQAQDAMALAASRKK